jgi:hypothetical protein
MKISKKTGWITFFLIFSMGTTFVAIGQEATDETQDEEDIIQRNVDISGQIGAYGQLYGISGRAARRPPSTGRLFIRPTITFLNELTLNFNILLTNEGVSARQSINQIGLDPSWGWGDAHVGDFSENFSTFTLNGITIRGGGVNLHPGSFRFSVVAGRSKRATPGGAGSKSYSRTVYGAKLGLGKQTGSYIDLIFFKAKDDVGSLPPDSLLTNPSAIYSDTTDTTVVGNAPPVNPYAVTPQENLVGGLNWQLQIVPDRVTWKSEMTGSMFTRDLRSNVISFSDLNAPSFAQSLYTPRYSSNADFAANTELDLNFNHFNIQTGYKWIGPGFTSLGTSYMINDQQEINSRISFQISQTTISLNWARKSDNLLGQKQFTTFQNRYGGNVNTRMTDSWNSTLSANIVSRGDNSQNDTTSVAFNNLVLNTSQRFMFAENPVFQNLSLNYSFQQARTESGLQPENINKTHTFNTGLSMKLMENLNSNTSLGFVSNQTSGSETRTTTTIGAGLSHHAFENKLNNSLNLSTSFRSQNVSVRTRINSSYRITEKDRLSLSLAYTNFKRKDVGMGDFNEFTTSLRISHRF